MKIQTFLILLACILLGITNAAAQTVERYSKVKVYFDDKHTVKQLAQLGVEADHGERGKAYLINDFSETELQQIRAAGFGTEILITDVSQYYANQNHETVATRGADDCNGKSKYKKPKRFRLGKMGGYYKYTDLIAVLDSMRLAYPKLISAKAEIGGPKTHENRPIYWFRISDNPDTEEKSEPQVLYTALHHAREPASVSQLIYYMWYLLENYDTNPEIKYLVNNTELYFVPCVNPDGYIYNETTNPNGGGLWRKNRRKNADGSFGVDLNRNYGFHWAEDDNGSSPTTTANTYRGPSAFSEPETRAIKKFCEAHTFLTAYNYHTYGNLLIYPWGYLDAVASLDLVEQAELLVSESKFLAGTGSETVGYEVNGCSDDWMYGDTTIKKQITSFTPEVSEGSFWAPAAEILGVCESTLRSNLDLAWLTHNYVVASEKSPQYISNKSENLSLSLKRYGLVSGTVSVQVKSLSPNASTSGSVQFFNLKKFEAKDVSIPYTINNTIQNFESIKFLVSINNADVVITDTIKKVYVGMGKGFEDNASTLNNWLPNTAWNTTPLDYKTAPTSIADSPIGNYANNASTQLSLKNAIDTKGAKRGVLQFYGKWDIEKSYDYVQVQASTDNSNFTALCGNYTSNGGKDQIKDAPIYDGKQSVWVSEAMDLSAFIGDKLWLRFVLQSDGASTFDGFYFDDLKVVTDKTITAINDVKDFEVRVIPNPATDLILIQNVDNEAFTFSLCDISGKQVKRETVQGTAQTIGVEDLANGIYIYQIIKDGRTLSSHKLVISK